MNKLPENIMYMNEEEVMERPMADLVTTLVKKFRVAPIKNGNGEVITTEDQVVRNLLLANFRAKDGEAFELPEDQQALSKLNNYIAESLVVEHRACQKVKEELKSVEKAKKQQEREQAKEAKEAENAQFKQSQDQFEVTFLAKFQRYEKNADVQFNNTFESIKLPKTIAFSGNKMGLVIGDAATKDDIATATSSLIAGLEGNKAVESALQFALGDVVNAAVKSKTFRTKNDACSAIKLFVEDGNKLNKKFKVGTLGYYASMAERVPAEKRLPNVPSSTYLAASKIVAPAALLKDKSAEEKAKIEAEYAEERNKVIDSVAAGETATLKQVAEKVLEINKARGIVPDNSEAELRKKKLSMYAQLFHALWNKQNLPVVNGKVKMWNEGDNVGEYDAGIFDDKIEEAMTWLENALIESPNDQRNGFCVDEKGEKTEFYPYYPFEDDVKPEEPQQAETPVEGDTGEDNNVVEFPNQTQQTKVEEEVFSDDKSEEF